MALLGLSWRAGRTVVAIGSRGICSKALRDIKDKPAPFDWKNKKYGLFRSMFLDRTSDRFDENTKVVVVEGPVAAGKTAFAKELASQLDMLHMEDVNMDMYYINHCGFDCRQLDDQMPDDMKSFDETNFNINPKHRNVAAFQAWMYRLRLSRYIDALAHVLSTGQGVVIERTPWTDGVFTDAMCDNGYISKGARFTMNELKRCTLPMLMKPHLVIYLDVPVSQVRENIKKRNKFSEAKGKALTDRYLETIEDNYKTKYLPQISEHAELMIYDWGTPGDVEIVVEDIERLDFEQYGLYDSKMNDWYLPVEKYLAGKRMLYADNKSKILSYLNVPALEAPEMWASGEDHKKWFEVWFDAPGNKYEEGYDPGSNPLSLLFKTKSQKYIPY